MLLLKQDLFQRNSASNLFSVFFQGNESSLPMELCSNCKSALDVTFGSLK